MVLRTANIEILNNTSNVSYFVCIVSPKHNSCVAQLMEKLNHTTPLLHLSIHKLKAVS